MNFLRVLKYIVLINSVYYCQSVSASETVAVKQKPVTLSRNVDVAVEKTVIEPYVIRIKAVHQAGRHLTEAEVKEIYAFLNKRPDEEKRLSNLEFNGIKNELVIALMNQQTYPAELTGRLAEMYRREELGVTWRDYCIQFLGQWYGRMQSDRERSMAQQAIYTALHEKDNGIAGTALIAAYGLAGQPGFKPEQLKAAAQALAGDPKVAYIARVPALQISAKMGNPQAIVTAREIIGGQHPAILKMSALAVLGIMGNADDMATLKKYQVSSDIRLRAAATAALHRLAKR